MRSDLTGVTVLVTRAPHQAGPLCKLIEQAKGIAVRFPVTKICKVENLPEIEAALANVRLADKIIFVSPNAVEFGLKVLKAHAIHIAAQTKILAVGPGTANRLREQGLTVSGISNDEGLFLFGSVKGVRTVSSVPSQNSGERIFCCLIDEGSDPRADLARLAIRKGSLLEFRELDRSLEHMFFDSMRDRPAS